MVNEAEVVEEDVGLINLLTASEIGESGNVSGGVRATNVGDIYTNHAVEKDLSETENFKNINLKLDEAFSEASERVNFDVDIVDENEQYIEEHLDGMETDVESSCDLQEEDIPEEDDSKVDEELRSVREEKRSKTKNLEADSDDSKDKLDPEVVAGVDLLGRRKSTNLRYDNECGISISELGMIFEIVKEFREVVAKDLFQQYLRFYQTVSIKYVLDTFGPTSIKIGKERRRESNSGNVLNQVIVKFKEEIEKLGKLGKEDYGSLGAFHVNMWYGHYTA
ncbi:hypothetical protein HAX54_022288 [Datura stramonium]|uniref:Uncharacterized protein n=1 Tax=Datura stramonium TaxID=4076 RepID=A0ABS8S3Y4_DATST|nr:hypothetical protein [Datura stramonium]